jgi:uracil-DNA glycosylase
MKIMSNQAVPLLRQYLQQQADQGRTHIGINAGARQSLNALSRGRPASGVPGPRSSNQSEGPSGRQSSPASAAGSGLPAPEALQVTGGTREEKLAGLAKQAANFPAARSLGTLCDTIVFAVGNPNADIMFIGEAPGAEEEELREPFVGPAGQLLTKIITAMGLKRADVYLTNICKFRPRIDDQGTANRKPTQAEMRTGLPFVFAEIDIVQPKVIVALGATASEGLGIEGAITQNRGRYHSVKDIPVVVTYHPSYLLRQEQEGRGIAAKRQSWEDILMAMEKTGMAITEKQRGFFKAR